MRRWLAVAGFVFALAPSLAAAEAAVPIPVRKVVLYKNGIGYFEHLGQVRGQQSVEIVLPSSQLNDVLKSLTVIDLGRGQVSGVTYDSAAPLDRRLAELPINLGTAQGLVSFLNQIRGTEIEIRAPGGPVAGRLMGAELKTRSSGPGATVQVAELAVFTSAGEIRTVELESAGALRLVDASLASDLGRYLELLSSSHQRDVRRLQIQTSGSGARQLYVSYTSEAPIWKTTYRIVLDEKQKPLLQGWAIVDNTTPMDWNDVELSLVAGAPVSFIQNLSQPLYARRPVIPLPEGLQVRPQTHEATLEVPAGQAAVAGVVVDAGGNPVPGATVQVMDADGNVVREGSTDASGRFSLSGLAPGTYNLQAVHPALGSANYDGIAVHSGRVTSLSFSLSGAPEGAMADMAQEKDELGAQRMARRERAAKVAEAPAASAMGAVGGRLGEVMRNQALAAARGQALGEQFEYKLRQPVTIRRNQSALLPIVHTEVEGEKVSLYNEVSGDPSTSLGAGKRPRLAVWLKNSSGLTLDQGSFTVIDSNAFAGEGLSETLNPQERRLLSYALDLGVEVTTNRDTERERVERVEILRGLMRLHSKVVEKKTYVLRNNDEKLRVVVLEHPVRPGWSLVETPTPAESSASFHRFRLEAKPKTTTEFAVREENPQETVYGLSNITPEQIGLWVRQKTIDAEIEKALQGIVAKKNEIDDFNKKINALEQDQNEIFRDQERVRNNLARLGGTPEEANLRLRYIRQLEQQENKLGTLRAERAKLEDVRAAAQKQLDDMLQNLTFDRKL
ncbi:MAG: carboxypeptidase regulatory-like domain-containing protein [Candidatus Acidiferrales bacterium]